MIEILDKPFFLICFLTGISFIITAIIQIIYPPQKINSFYGYRTTTSIKSKESWDFAQKYSSKLMLIFGVGLCITALMRIFISDLSLEYELIISIILINLIIILMINKIEKELKKRF